MNRIRYRAECVLASEKGVLTAAMGKEATPERTSIAYPNPTAKAISIQYGQFLVTWAMPCTNGWQVS